MPMGDELASTSLNFTQKSMEISVELIKILAPLVKKLWDKAFNSQHPQVGKVSQAQLFMEAGKAKSAILSNDNFLSKDADTIVEKAKKYGIPVSVVGDGEKVTLSYLERDKAVVNQILQETMRERMKTAPQDVKHFTVEECNLSAIKAEFEKNGIECCFARSANGKIFCQYPAEAAGKVEIVKQDFKAAREKVAYEFKAYPENGKIIIEDAKQQKKIEFSEKLTQANVQKICMEQFGYSKTEADLAAKKLFDDVSPVQNKLMMEKLTAEKYFANTAQLDAIRSMKVNIRYESDSIYLRNMTFTAVNFADSEHTHISITNGDKATALTPATMSREEMRNICVSELEMTEEQANEAVEKSVKIDMQINSKLRETTIFRNTGETQTVEIDRTSNNSFSVRLGSTKRDYDLNDEKLAAKISKDFGITEGKAKTFINKAQKQSAFQNNVARTAKSAKDKASAAVKNLKENIGKHKGAKL